MEEISFIDLKAAVRQLEPGLTKAIQSLLSHTWFVNGPEVREAEAKLAEHCGMPYALTVASGTEALNIVMRALRVGEGDAVIMPGFTFPAAAEVAIMAGAVPVLVDIVPDTFNIDTAKVQAAIDFARDSGLVPRMLVAVDLYGLAADLDELAEIANRNSMYFVDDAAQSFGATYGGRVVPSVADIGVTSFYPAKPLGVFGEGGAIFCRDANFLEIATSLRSHGCGSHAYDHVRVGLNGRFDTIQAAVLLEKLKVFDEELKSRRALAEQYTKLLAEVSGVGTPKTFDDRESSWAQYTIVLDDIYDRGKLQRSLKARGVPTAVHYPKILDEHAAFAVALVSGDLQNAREMSRRVLSLPFHPYLSARHLELVVQRLAEVLPQSRK